MTLLMSIVSLPRAFGSPRIISSVAVATTMTAVSSFSSEQATPQLDIQPVTTERFEDLAALFRTGLARVCWDMEPRQIAAEDTACRQRWRAQGISRKDGRRQAFGDLLAQGHMPGLLARRRPWPT